MRRGAATGPSLRRRWVGRAVSRRRGCVRATEARGRAWRDRRRGRARRSSIPRWVPHDEVGRRTPAVMPAALLPNASAGPLVSRWERRSTGIPRRAPWRARPRDVLRLLRTSTGSSEVSGGSVGLEADLGVIGAGVRRPCRRPPRSRPATSARGRIGGTVGSARRLRPVVAVDVEEEVMRADLGDDPAAGPYVAPVSEPSVVRWTR